MTYNPGKINKRRFISPVPAKLALPPTVV